MDKTSLGRRASQGYPEASKTADAADRVGSPPLPPQGSPAQLAPLRSGSSPSSAAITSTAPSATSALSSLQSASAVGAGQRASALRAELLQDAAPPLAPVLLPNEIDDAWNQIVDDDLHNSAASRSQSMIEAGVLDDQKHSYMKKVGDWLNHPQTRAQLTQQKHDIAHHAISKTDMLPGDILLRKEAPPQSTAHASTLPFQIKANLNGIEPNTGDHNIFHVAQWIGDKRDPSMDKKVEIAEARGGLGTTNALRVLAQSIQVGQYWVYRAHADYGLPEDARETLLQRQEQQLAEQVRISEARPVTPIIGKASSVVAEVFAANSEPYSKSMLSTSMRADSEFVALTPAVREDMIKLAANPGAMSHVGVTSEDAHYHAIKTLENLGREKKRGVKRDGGDTCSTFVVRTAQTAALQIAAAYYVEKVRQEAAGQNLDSPQTRQHLRDELGFDAEGEINAKVREMFDDALSGFTGLIATNPEGVAPKTIEHFCRDKNNFEFVGVLTIAPHDVLQKEQRFDANGQPVAEEIEVASRRSSGSAEGHDCCVVS